MRKLIFVLLGLFISGFVIAKPNWVLLHDKTPNSITSYIDTASVDKRGFWMKFIPPKSLTDKFEYSLAYFAIDCSSRTENIRTLILYDKHDNVISRDENLYNPATPPPGSDGEDIMNSVCKE